MLMEVAAFRVLQDSICQETTVFYMDPDRQLFLQINALLEYSFGIMAFHL